MRVINEHECKKLVNQNYLIETDNEMAVQEFVHENKNGEVIYKGWYLMNYRKEIDIAFGIRYCPYCGKKLKKS